MLCRGEIERHTYLFGLLGCMNEEKEATGSGTDLKVGFGDDDPDSAWTERCLRQIMPNRYGL